MVVFAVCSLRSCSPIGHLFTPYRKIPHALGYKGTEIRRFQRGQKIAKVSTENTKAKKTVSYSSELEGKVKRISILNKMTKKELEDYGRTFGFEVDRRLTKDKIINQVKKLK